MNSDNYSQMDKIATEIVLEKPVAILYLGDSLTAFDRGNNHADKVEYFLNKYHPGMAKVWNYAAGGDYIERIVHRLNGIDDGKYKDYYQDLWERNYDWAFIFLGHNDTKSSSAVEYAEPLVPPEKQRVLYEELITKLIDKDIQRIILLSPTSSNYALCKANADKNEAVHNRFGEPKFLEAFDAVLRELASKHHLEYMDVYTPMQKLATKNELVNDTDGVHLTAKGHDFIALETLRYLRDNSAASY